MYHLFPNSALVSLIFLIYISILQTTAQEVVVVVGGGGRLVKGVRLWLFI